MVRVLGNTWMPIGVGGNFMPGASQGTSSAEYYKCASVDTGGTVVDESTLVASGFGTRYGFEVDGTYTIQSGSGTDRVYVKGSIILSYNTGSSCWEFTAPDFEPDPLALTAASCETPWDATSWITVAGSPLSGATVSRSETTTSGSTWSGYKAVFDSGTGTWSFESDATEGLTYTGLTPVVNKIYTADTTIQIAYIKLAGILNDETVKFLLYPKSSGTLEDISAGGNGITVTNTGSVAVENNRIVFGDGKALIIPANTLPNDIFVSGSPFLIEFQGIIPTYTSVACCPWSRKNGSMYYDRLDMFLNTIEGDSRYGQMTIGYWTDSVDVPVGAFTVGA